MYTIMALTNIYVYNKISLYIQYTPACFSQPYALLLIYFCIFIISFYACDVSGLCIIISVLTVTYVAETRRN